MIAAMSPLLSILGGHCWSPVTEEALQGIPFYATRLLDDGWRIEQMIFDLSPVSSYYVYRPDGLFAYYAEY